MVSSPTTKIQVWSNRPARLLRSMADCPWLQKGNDRLVRVCCLAARAMLGSAHSQFEKFESQGEIGQ